MEEKDNKKNSTFNRLSPATCEHLKPLSVYSMMISCEQKGNLHPIAKFSNPFINFKIEVLNNCLKKRKVDDSLPDRGYETPAFSPKDLSPDLGCFMDSNTPPARQDSLSPFATSKPALLDRTQSISSERRETVSSQLHVECGSSIEPWSSKVSVPHGLKSEEVLLNPAPDFDCDVDDILCLNPFGTSSSGRPSEKVESCKFAGRFTFEKKPVLNPSVVHRLNMERGDWQVEEDQEEHIKNMVLNVKDVEEDKSYSSVSFIKDHEMKNLSELPLATSSHQIRVDTVKQPEDEIQPGSSPEQDSQKQAALSGQVISFTAKDLCPVVYGSQLESLHCPVETLEGDVEDFWNIGPPRFESSLCQKVSEKLDDGVEQVSENLQRDVIETIHERQVPLSIEETTLDTSYETTLTRVKVKSVVVAAIHPTSDGKLASLPELNGSRGFQPTRSSNSARNLRPVISKWEVDWEREKHLYIHSVTRHMNEKPHGGPDVVMELQNLMTHVADQTSGNYGRQWQHPSDLTHRNYKQRFGNGMSKMPLNQWQAKNCPTHKRFNKVPKIFERSPFP
ncbi:uncharacterized protein [Labrus bergylta]|uniref:uncharacterized protein n=1 Tax=Labrus bergylta TaxID=56723 RepID=UPI0033140566